MVEAQIYLDPAFPNAKLPERATNGSAGMDIFSAENAIIPARGRILIATGLRFSLPQDLTIASISKGESSGIPISLYLRLAPRSGLAYKFGLDVFAGVVDVDFEGLVGVIMHNSGQEDYQVKTGDRICQAICELIVTPEIKQIFTYKTCSVRGEGGFGSTDQKKNT